MVNFEDRLLERLKELLEPLLEEMDLVLYDMEYKRGNPGYLRVYVERKDGTSPTVGECERLSNMYSIVLDAEDLIDHRYYLEVSSPGVERRLRDKADFERYVGYRVRVKLKEKVGASTQYTGILKAVKEDTFLIEIAGKVYELSFDNVKSAKLKFTTEELFEIAKKRRQGEGEGDV